MDQDALATLLLPLLFAVAGGIYGFQKFPERRPALLLNLISFQLLGAVMFREHPALGLMTLMSLYSLVVACLLVFHLQHPLSPPAPVKVERR